MAVDRKARGTECSVVSDRWSEVGSAQLLSADILNFVKYETSPAIRSAEDQSLASWFLSPDSFMNPQQELNMQIKLGNETDFSRD